ncbi:MAG: DNA recombination protein RmuC [Rhodoluna sp.]|nr:DNA recombination protein RmuC [Rhodoluna sp.]
MDTTTIFLILNLLATLGLLLVIFSRRDKSPSQEISKDLLTHRDELRASISTNHEVIEKRLTAIREAADAAAKSNREEATQSRLELQKSLNESLKTLESKISELTDSNAKKLQEIQSTLQLEMEKMRKGNEEKLEKMRETVDEKLQGTLEKRLGESFKLVSDNLEAVQRGLGEMKNLATDVGSLQKVLSNVKSRGGWGEVQLERQLEDVLAPNQYAKNVKIKPDTNDVVEFAVKLPGRADGEYVYLPIDSKFPQEDYERLQLAQETGTPEEIINATKAVEKAIRTQAKLISDKYLYVPVSTDFAIMYLPTEGLFAEVVRRPGLTSDLQNNYRVLVTGPTTLMSLLNSLQMGFKTLAIEKSASDVWKVLGAAKTEFTKYAGVMDKLAKQLETAQNTVSEAGRRTRAVQKTLKDVEGLELTAATDLLAIPLATDVEDEDLEEE